MGSISSRMNLGFRIPSTKAFTNVVLSALLLLGGYVSRADDTWIYAVQISAVVQTAPPQIELSWRSDYHVVTNYLVYRKAKEATWWGYPVCLPGTVTNYIDTDVAVGGSYEYQIVKVADGYNGYGYIFAGIETPLTEARGKLILVVDVSHADSLSNELSRLEDDLTGDGWTVIRHDVATNDTPDSVKNLIINDYYADPANVNAVFLFGHIPIFRSGDLNYDGHLARPLPGDTFYGDMVGAWDTNLNFLPADVQLMVGRVDMANMPGQYAVVPWPTEVELLRNYLNKDHAWRHKLVDVPRRALIGDRRGDAFHEGSAATAYRNFEPFVGPGNMLNANVSDVSPPEVRWGPMLTADSYLWAYGCGGGAPNAISELGTEGLYNDLYSADVIGEDLKAVFVMLFGSWFGEWDVPDNLMRAFLATPSLGLTCFISGRPQWFVHHMGLGETIGYSARLTMNNDTLYQSQSNLFTRAIYVSLMGDPTLRLDRVSPPSALSATADSTGVILNWAPSYESVLGYHVYRRTSPTEPFIRLTDELLTDTSFTDTDPLSGTTTTYMVRAVTLQTTPSGTYFNASQGVFATVGTVGTPIRLLAQLSSYGLTLTWNAQPGTVYHVLASEDLDLNNWTDVSGEVTAIDTTVSWTDVNIGFHSQQFYRVKQN